MFDRTPHSSGPPSVPAFRFLFFSLFTAALAASVGCNAFHDKLWGKPTPSKVGLNTRDLIDPEAQANADRSLNVNSLIAVGSELKRVLVERAELADPDRKSRPPKNVLCLSGGGSYGAFSAGLLVGWTESGTRPRTNDPAPAR